MKILILLLLSFNVSAALSPYVMEQLAAQIPGVSTGETTPKDMHEAWDRYEATVEMYKKEGAKYRINCYKAFFNAEKITGTDIVMIKGVSPDALCNYLGRRVEGGWPVPEIKNLLEGSIPSIKKD